MGQQECDNFKRLIRKWLDSHPSECAAFVEEMNGKEFKGFVEVFKAIITLVLRHKGATRRRTRDDEISNFEGLENVFLDSDLVKKIVNEFHHSERRSIIPAMLAWLHYGRSYERMAEQGEELAKRKGITRLYKWLVSYMARFTIRKSISSGIKTKEDWVAFRKQQKAIEESSLVEWSIEDEEDIEETETKDTDSLQQGQPKSAGRKADTRTLSELLIENRDVIPERIGTRLRTHTIETDIARMYIALVEYRLVRSCPIETLWNALQQQYTDLSIVHERGIQKVYRNLTSSFGGSEKLIKDIGEDHVAIEELEAYLSA